MAVLWLRQRASFLTPCFHFATAAGSDWPFRRDKLRYFQARGNPGADAVDCALQAHAHQPYSSVFPGGTPSFCVLKPGYPGVKPSLGQLNRTITGLCGLTDELSLTETLNWKQWCSPWEQGLLDLPSIVLNDWKTVSAHLNNLVGLSFHGVGYKGPVPEAISRLSMLVELDLSRNAFEGMNPNTMGCLSSPWTSLCP